MNEIDISGYKFRVFETGEIQREMKTGWKTVKNFKNHSRGYNVIMINKKQYMRSRVMLLAFKDAFQRESMPEKFVMHHKDGNCLNCALSNLTVETYSSISYYRTDTGCQYDPVSNTYKASITVNGTLIQLGNYHTAEEAHGKILDTRTLLQQSQLT
jgi:hypothetical protein